MAVKIYHGDILFTPAADRMEIHENSYIMVWFPRFVKKSRKHIMVWK